MDQINFNVSRKLMQLYELLIIVQLERVVNSILSERVQSEAKIMNETQPFCFLLVNT